MAAFEIQTAQATYQNLVERGVLGRASEFLPPRAGKVFIITQREIWDRQGARLEAQIRNAATTLFLPSGEPEKRLANVERLAEQMVEGGADRSSLVIGFGGGIVTDVAGLLAAIFMRGLPVLQLPTTLLAQVDAAIGGKTGVNLACGKNLIGSFHQPLAVLIDPEVLETLPEREFRAGLFEVIKCAVIRDPELFRLLELKSDGVLAREVAALDAAIAAAVRVKAEVVSADEREGDLRRILNFGHTVGHALETETHYGRFLHGEAVAWGMLAAIRLAELAGCLNWQDSGSMRELIGLYARDYLPPVADLDAERLLARLSSDKKTLGGRIHFVLPVGIGQVTIRNDIDAATALRAIRETFV